MAQPNKKDQKQLERERVYRAADNFIQQIRQKYEAPRLQFLARSSGSQNQNDQLFPFAPEQSEWQLKVEPIQIPAEILKNVRSSKQERLQFEKKRQPRGKENKTFVDEIKKLEDKSRNNVQTRFLKLEEKYIHGGKDLKNINIEDYQYFIVQKFTDWNNLKNRVTEIIDNLKMTDGEENFFTSFFSKLAKNEKQSRQAEVQSRIESIVNYSFLLIQNWQVPENENARIICIHKDIDVEQGHFYIYTKQRMSGKSLIAKQRDILTFKDVQQFRRRLIMAYFANKFAQKVKQVNRSYINKTKENITNQLIFKNLQQNFVKPVIEEKPVIQKEIVVESKQKMYSAYQNQQILALVQKWKEKALAYNQKTPMILYIQPTHIHVPKNIFVKRLTLSTSGFDSQFRYSHQNENFFVFQSQSSKTYHFNLAKVTDSSIHFDACIVDEDNLKYEFKNKIKVYKMENESLGYSFELALIPNDLKLIASNNKHDFPYILYFQAAVRKASQFQTPENLKLFREINLVSKMGKIPNLYSSFYEYNYNPNLHSTVSQILRGSTVPLNELNFQKMYLEMVKFFQREENKSQNYCEYVGLTEKKISSTRCFVMKDRYKRYMKLLEEEVETVKKNYEPLQASKEVKVNKSLIKKELADLKNYLKKTQLYNSSLIQVVLKRYILYEHFLEKQNKNKNKNENENRRIGVSLAIINIADFILQIYHCKEQNSKFDVDQLSIFFIAFIKGVYHYQENQGALLEDLLQLRILAQKYLPQFNYLLNRKGIGLENFASNYLLQLFSVLPRELCYRIWDFLLTNKTRQQNIRVITVFTLMLYQQKSNFLPIFPINQILDSIQANMSRVVVDVSGYYNLKKLVENNYKAHLGRQRKISCLSKYKYLRKFIFGSKSKTELLDEDDFERVGEKIKTISSQRVHNRLGSIKQLKYPLPMPGYQGFGVTKVYVFVGGLFLLSNLNLHSREYYLKIKLGMGDDRKEFPISQKSSFLNEFIELEVDELTNMQIQFQIIEKPKNKILYGALNLIGFHKDIAYRQNIVLTNVLNTKLNNLGTSVANIAFIIKSIRSDTNANITSHQPLGYNELNEKIFDYDISPENNEAVKAMMRVDKKLKKILDPLDQLEGEKYLDLRTSSSFEEKKAQWLKNTRTSIEQLKAIFSFVFAEDSEKSIRLSLPTFYESYTENFQQFELGNFLLDLILMSQISKGKKLSMIYCLGVHYQNICQNKNESQNMSVDTLNSIIKEITKSTGFINACPYQNRYRGQIVYACYYEKGNKVQENKRDITQILQDWAYISQLKCGNFCFLLGTVEDLSILRAMLPSNTIDQIQRDPLCRFQMHYRVGKQTYIWSATVNSSDFSIAKRGIKFLNSYPKYNQGQEQLSSTAEILLNCQNLISLQQCRSIDFDQFTQIFENSPLLDFLLSQNEWIGKGTDKKSHSWENVSLEKNFQQYRSSLGSSIIENQGKMKRQEYYTDFAIYRGQNSLACWQKCKVRNNVGKSLCDVQFKDKKGIYKVPRYEIICLDQIQLKTRNNIRIEPSQSSLSQYTERN